VKASYGVIAAIWLMLGLVPAATVRAQAKAGTPERELFDDANRERSTRGLPLLRWDAELADAARLHALRMARQNALSHQFAGEPELAPRLRQSGAHFSAVAENVAEGPTPAMIHNGWMKSPGHRENLLDPQLNSLGIAVVEGHGQLFAVQDFSKSVAELSLADEERKVSARLKEQGLQVQAGAASARSACESGQADVAGHRSVFVFRYSATDLKKLPDALEQEIHKGRYTEAAVGACSSSRDASFSTYSLAVLLYEQ
jgi:hypothetical protein